MLEDFLQQGLAGFHLVDNAIEFHGSGRTFDRMKLTEENAQRFEILGLRLELDHRVFGRFERGIGVEVKGLEHFLVEICLPRILRMVGDWILIRPVGLALPGGSCCQFESLLRQGQAGFAAEFAESFRNLGKKCRTQRELRACLLYTSDAADE